MVGPLLASLLVGWIGLRPAIGFALVPGLLAAIAITLAARRARSTLIAPSARSQLSFRLHELRRAGLLSALAPAAAFEFGHLAATLLILRGSQLLQSSGRTPTAAAALAILLYSAHNGVAALASIGAGAWADRSGPRVVLGAGAACYLAAYLGMAAGPGGWAALLACFAAAGIGIGLAETAQSTSVARALPDRLRGNGFGVLGLVQAAGDLVATLVAGLLWASAGAPVAFGYAACWMAASLAVAVPVAIQGQGARK